MLYAMPKAQYRMVRLRRPDVLRAQKMLAQLGGTYLTDFFHIASFMTAEEFMELSGKAGDRKMHEWQRRRDAGEVPIRPEELRVDADEDRTHEVNTAAADDAGEKESDQ